MYNLMVIFRPLGVIFACFNVFASWMLEILLISQGHLNNNTTLSQKLTGLMNPKFGRHVEPSANVTDKSTTGVRLFSPWSMAVPYTNLDHKALPNSFNVTSTRNKGSIVSPSKEVKPNFNKSVFTYVRRV